MTGACRSTALLVGLALLTGCSSSGSTAADPAAPAASPRASSLFAPAPTGCPTPPPAEPSWPGGVPVDLPHPPGTSVTEVEDRTDGLTVVQFTTPISLRDSILFVVDALPEAGYTLARGDAESTEADAPFVKGDLRGVMRMIAVEPCRTDWLLALAEGAPATSGTGSPLLPTRPDASPLPFG